MKSVKEINAIISKLSNQAAALENQGSELLDKAKILSNSWHGSRFADTKNNPDFTRWQELHAAADNAYIKAGELKKIIVVWRYNLMHAKKAELLPIWAGVMNEYQGKQIGETRKNEIREKLRNLGIAGYFSKYSYSSPKINIAFLDKNGFCSSCDYIELTGDYNIEFFDENNRFVIPDLSSFRFYGENTAYIENPKQYINKLTKLANKAKQAAAAYDKALSDYNSAAVPGFAQIDTYNTAPASIAGYFKINK